MIIPDIVLGFIGVFCFFMISGAGATILWFCFGKSENDTIQPKKFLEYALSAIIYTIWLYIISRFIRPTPIEYILTIFAYAGVRFYAYLKSENMHYYVDLFSTLVILTTMGFAMPLISIGNYQFLGTFMLTYAVYVLIKRI